MSLIFFKFMSNQAEYQMCHLFVCQTAFPVAGSAGGSQKTTLKSKKPTDSSQSSFENHCRVFSSS